MSVTPSPLLSEVGQQSDTLWERLQRKLRGAEVPPPESVAKILGPWARACARGDFAALLRRLSWDAVDPQQAAAALSAGRAHAAPRPWLDVLEEYVKAAAAGADTGGSQEKTPFVELWLPWVSVAEARLARHPHGTGVLTDAGAASIRRNLLVDIGRLSESAAYHRFCEVRGEKPAPGSEVYEGFIGACLADPLRELYTRFPVLARQTAVRVEQWCDAMGELLSRYRDDRPDIARDLFAGEDPGPIVDVGAGVSDRHFGGREVLLLTTASGARLVYKPRSLDPERAFADFVGWCDTKGLGSVPPVARIMCREGYGWMEWVAADEIRDAETYYRRAGALIAIAYLLGAEDLHAENLVASAAGPVVVDAEVLLQPVFAADTTGEDEGAVADVHSCLSSGLLTQILGGGRENRDIGGLTAPMQRRESRRDWSGINTDQMAVEIHDADVEPYASVARGPAGRLEPEAYRHDVCGGFAEAYRWLLARRSELLAEGGPIAVMASTEVRVLFRESQEYGRVLQLGGVARNQRSGLTGGWLQEAMLSDAVAASELSPLWPLWAVERSALERGDVPWFSVRADSTRMEIEDHEGIDGVFGCSGVDAVRRRLEGWGEEGLSRQLGLLRASLIRHRETPEYLVALAAGGDESLDVGAMHEAATEVAAAIGRHVVSRIESDVSRIESDPAPTRWDLGSGDLGVAFFLSCLETATGDDSLGLSVSRLLEPLSRDVEKTELWDRLPIGGFSGLGSVAWTLAWLARQREAPELLTTATSIAQMITAERIDSCEDFDVERGCAGAILGLLAVAAETDDRTLVARARRCGEHLLARQQPVGSTGAAWRNRRGLMQTGWMHGAAGVARALAALGQRCGDERFTVAAIAALAYERNLYDPARRNWPVFLVDRLGTRKRTEWMVSCCRGAPGVALARLYLPASLLDETIEAEREIALETTASTASGPFDHLCCGLFGAELGARVSGARDRWRDAQRARQGARYRKPRAGRDRWLLRLPEPLLQPALRTGLPLWPGGYWLSSVAPDRA